jgi:ubiquinone/menaquinone biosynthesis C-methylase UbiE
MTGSVVHWAARYDLLIGLLTLGKERQFRERLVELAHLQRDESVLDIGCGTGSLALAAARSVGPSGAVHGIDASPEMIARARKKSTKAGLSIVFEVALAQSLPFPDSQFDVVLSTVMLHHLPRDGRGEAVREARRVLRPGGRLLAVDFGRSTAQKKGLLGHIHRHGGVDATALMGLATDAGLTVIESGPAGKWDLQFVLASKP